jgi:hypothetical protein
MTIVVTNQTGGTTQPLATVYVPPDRQVLDAGSGTALADSGLDPTMAADLLSACLAHERCGAHLYRSVAGRTAVPALRVGYEQFEVETVDHVEKLETLITAAGGDPQYVSPSARATEKAAAGLLESTFLIAGSIDPATAELTMLEAVMLAEAKDRANWWLLSDLSAQMTAGDLRSQFEAVCAEVLTQEEEHYSWAMTARAEMLLALVAGSPPPPADEGSSPNQVSRDELYRQAQELDIAGRSQMNKDELQAAVEAEHDGGASS